MIILPSSMMRISYTKTIFYTSFRCYKLLGKKNEVLRHIGYRMYER